MKRKWLLLVGAAALLALSWRVLHRGEAPRAVLEGSQQLILYSLYPNLSAEIPGQMFHHFRVLGTTEIKDAKLKRQLIAALYRDLGSSPEEVGGIRSGCHLPRHGLRAVKNGQTIDATVCFECGNAYFYDNDHITEDHWLSRGEPNLKLLFNRVFMRAGIPLAKE